MNPIFEFTRKGLSAEDIITHEVGIHNMAQKAHAVDQITGEAEYPTNGLETNIPGEIKPTEAETELIINANTIQGRVDYVD